MKRDEVRNMATYIAIQSIVENAVMQVQGLENVDRSRLTPYVFNGIVSRAKAINQNSEK